MRTLALALLLTCTTVFAQNQTPAPSAPAGQAPTVVLPPGVTPGANLKVVPVTPGSNVQLPANTIKPAANQKLHDDLVGRMQSDQATRREVMTKYPQGQPLPPDVVAQMQKADAENTAWLKELIQQNGWPGTTQAGSDGSMAAFLIAQHTPDLDFQKQCLELIQKAAQAGEAPKSYVAYLVDRIRMREGKPQVYGTQMKMADGKVDVYDLEDPANVDKRRAEMDMPPLSQYVQMMNRPH